MIVVYISGPISSPSAWVREQNILRAEKLRLDLLDAGCAPICVHSCARTTYGERHEEVFLSTDFVLVERSDAVALVEGWERSRGTAREIVHAHQVHVPVFRELEDLKRWEAFVDSTHGGWTPEYKRQRRRLAVDYGALVPGSEEP